MIRARRHASSLLLWIAALATSLPSLAGEPGSTRQYLQRLRERGFADLAVDYLESAKTAGRLPDDLAEVFDLEMAESLLRLAGEASSPDHVEHRLAAAQHRLESFLAEHKEHPELAAANRLSGDIASQRAKLLIRLAESDEARRPQRAEEARNALEIARQRYQAAVDRAAARLQAVDARERASTKGARSARTGRRRGEARDNAESIDRDAVELLWLDARFKLALVDYYLARTYADAKDPKRTEALGRAAAAFDAIYQQYRTAQAGLYAHMWHGRTLDELGDVQTALDIYDEVLVNAPEPNRRGGDEGLDALFAQVALFRLELLRKKGDAPAFLAEAREWLKLHARERRTAGYQAIALALAREELAAAEKLEGRERQRAMGPILRDLAEIARVPGEHQQDAILLARKYRSESGGEPAAIGSFDEGLAVGDDLARDGQWSQAAEAYAKALAFREKEKDPEKIAALEYRLAQAHFLAGRPDQAVRVAEPLARAEPPTKVSPPAAALAVQAALSIYATSSDKSAALERLTKLAEFTTGRWPNRPEADDARIALGQARLVGNDPEAAIEVFQSVDSRSERYPLALALAGQTHWQRYLLAKRQAASADSPQLAARRTAAEKNLRESLERQKKALRPGEPPDRQLKETQLLLAEIALEANDANRALEAVALVEPLTSGVSTGSGDEIDSLALRILVTALRAYLAAGKIELAGKIASLVADSGADNAPVNGILVEFARVLLAETGKPGGDSAKPLLFSLLVKLSAREKLSAAQRVFLGDALLELGDKEKAAAVYQKFLSLAESDPNFLPKESAGAKSRVQAQLVGLLRAEGKFEAALRQAEDLIAANPRAIEPLVEKGRILEAWAANDPSRLDAAVAHWAIVRNMLARLRPKPPEYYEAVAGAAECLLKQQELTQDQEKAHQAEILLKATMIQSPTLGGAKMRERYQRLLERALFAQGRANEAVGGSP